MAARVSSLLLDLFGVNHLRTGPQIQLVGYVIDVDEISGPLTSPLVVVLCAALFVLWRRMTLIRSAFVFLTGAMWLVFPPIAAVVAIALLWQTQSSDLTTGWSIHAVRLAAFALFLGLLASSERLVLFLCGPMIVLPSFMTPLTAWWNRQVAGVQTLPPESNVAALTLPVYAPVPPQAIWQPPLKFAHKWVCTRNPRWMLLGLPALATDCLVVASITVALSNSNELGRRYGDAVEAALAQDDLIAAELCYRRLVREEPGNAATPLRLARIFQQRGENGQAREIMQSLAPLSDGDHPDAHLRLAKDLASQGRPLTGEEAESLRSHLRHAIRLRPSLTEAHVMLAMIYLAEGRVEAAIKHLRVAVDDHPELRLVLTRAYFQQRNVAEAQVELKRVIDHCRQRVEADPTLADQRLLWAQAELLQKNYTVVSEVLDSPVLPPTDPRRLVLLSSVHVDQADALWRQDPPQRDQVLEHLRQALQLTPDNPTVLNRLSVLAHEGASQQAAIRQQLEQLLADGVESPGIHMALGTIALDTEQYAAAVTHFERGLELAPEIVELTSNLAWSLANCDPPQLDRALQLADAAVQAGTPNPRNLVEFRVSRGILLVKAERWDEAIAELEEVAELAADRSRVHMALADAYQAMGLLDAATVHRQAAAAPPDDTPSAAGP